MTKNLFSRELRDLAFVPRWAIARVIRRQSVAEHSYYVTCYTYQVARAIKYDSHSEVMWLLVAALQHDIDESFMSDIPGPVKRNIKDVKLYDEYSKNGVFERFGQQVGVSGDMKSIIKVADLIDECMYLAGEVQLGNESLRGFERSARDRLNHALNLLPGSHDDITNLRQDLFKAISHQRHGSSIPPMNNDDVAP